MRIFKLLKWVAFLTSIFLGSLLYGQTTGKVAGLVTDASTGEPLTGANVFLEGTSLGAAVGADGEFYIINVPAGNYTLVVQMVGYETQRITNFRVSVNRTANVDIALRPTTIEGEVIEVQAEKFATKKDETSSMRTISSDQIEILPVENLSSVVAMQAGVVQGHFRGGRRDEVSYLIDGLQVDNALGGEGELVSVEPEAIEDLEIITGTFNAEYGRAMSGVVNAVTKDGSDEFKISASVNMANYYTPHKDIFIGLDDSEFNRNQDYKVQMSGPIWKGTINYFTNIRYQDSKNYLNGVRRFNMNDYSDFSATDPALWYSEHSGDSSYVPMNNAVTLTVLSKLSFKLTSSIRASVMYALNQDEWHHYYHAFKYDPDGRAATHHKSQLISFNWNQALSNKAFYELKLSYLDNYYGYYLYKDPYDSRYLYDAFLGNINETGFYTGGQMKDHSESWQWDYNLKFDFTWQATKNHALKTGFLYTPHTIKNVWTPVQNDSTKTPDELSEYYYDENGHRVYYNYKPMIYPDNSIYSDIYTVSPWEFSAYLQDKMEFSDMVMNIGLRFDYFDPNSVYPSQLRNPANQLNFYLKDDQGNILYDENGQPMLDPERMSSYPRAEAKYQVSPRLGLAYQLGKKAVLHFSYGHFFQMPPMYAMYQNHSFLVAPSDYATTMGNVRLKAQKTVQYEIGLWQEIIDNMGLEVSLYYRDIYDLLSTKIISTYNQIEYGLYTNKDYGNSRGLEIKFDYTRNPVQIYVNYTLQYTRGNADNPLQNFDRAGRNQDPVTKLIPMSWDQRHTFNATVGYYKKDFGVTATGYYNSGTPYTWTPILVNPVSRVNLFPNNAPKPSTYSVDLNAFFRFDLYKNLKARVILSVYNLLDRLNAVWVYGSTGQPYTTIIQESDKANHRSDFNTYEDRVRDPSAYAAPRMVKIGLEISY